MHALPNQLGPVIPSLAALALTAATPPINAAPLTVGGVGFETGNVRDVIRLTWGAENGLTNAAGPDLAVFEQHPSGISSFASGSPLFSPTCPPTRTPEPATLALMAMGLGLWA